jgi:peroxiredoxin
MRHLRLAIFASALATLTLVGFRFAGPQATGSGQRAPAVNAQGTDGKTHTIQSLTRSGSAFFYFVKIGCPVNEPNAKYYDRIAAAYPGRVVGVINGDMNAAKRWSKQHGGKMVLIPDPNKSLINAFRAERSPWVIEVLPGGAIGQVWSGISVKALNEINGAVAKAAKRGTATIDFQGAPTRLTAG